MKAAKQRWNIRRYSHLHYCCNALFTCLKVERHQFLHIKVCLHVFGRTTAFVKKKKKVVWSLKICSKSEKLPQARPNQASCLLMSPHFFASLHWLPISWILFKILLVTHRDLHSHYQTPSENFKLLTAQKGLLNLLGYAYLLFQSPG